MTSDISLQRSSYGEAARYQLAGRQPRQRETCAEAKHSHDNRVNQQTCFCFPMSDVPPTQPATHPPRKLACITSFCPPGKQLQFKTVRERRLLLPRKYKMSKALHRHRDHHKSLRHQDGIITDVTVQRNGVSSPLCTVAQISISHINNGLNHHL